ncbi:olfactory receptor 11A1-like [Rhinophrynus dorsalis]
MTFTGCIVQYYFEAAFIVSECYLLTMMSYDRYLAICNPLRYISIMGIKLSLHLVLCSWILGFLIPMVSTISLSFLEYCGGNIIDHIYCDFVPLVELSCSDTSFLKVQALVFSAFAVIGPFVFINVTYISIFLTILNISSKIGRKKAFSTCSSHLMVVCTYYGTLTAKYIVPSNGNSLTVSKVISLLYTVVTPLFNPIVYSLRNQEIWKALGKWHSVKI